VIRGKDTCLQRKDCFSGCEPPGFEEENVGKFGIVGDQRGMASQKTLRPRGSEDPDLLRELHPQGLLCFLTVRLLD